MMSLTSFNDMYMIVYFYIILVCIIFYHFLHIDTISYVGGN